MSDFPEIPIRRIEKFYRLGKIPPDKPIGLPSTGLLSIIATMATSVSSLDDAGLFPVFGHVLEDQRECLMSVCLYLNANFSKQLKTLRKRGGSPTMAAAHAQSIIDQLVEGGCRGPRQMGRLTRHGEARIKNSFKFDLVKGYRMIGVMRGKEITFLFVGSHDECDHWIKNNAGREPMVEKRRDLLIEIREGERTASSLASLERGEPEPDYDERVLGSVTDRQLRKIFSGICGG